MDIKSFFRSIDKQILWNIVLKKIEQQDKPYWWKEEVLHLSKLIIFHNPARNYIFKGNLSTKNLIPTYKSLLNGDTTKGLPIGNLTSQFFANVYMNELDQYVEHVLKYDKYARYVDDFVMFDEDNEKLKRDMQNISLFCQGRLNLGMANHKTVLRNTYIGIDFLGYYIKSTHTLVRKKVVKRFKNKFFGVLDGDGFVGMGDIPMIKSYVGHFEHANSEGLKVKYRLV